MLNELVHSPTLSAVDNAYFAAVAVAAAMAGDRRTAAGTLASLRGRDLADLPRSSSWLVTMYGIVEAAHLLDEPGIHTGSPEPTHLFPQRTVDQILGGIQPDAPQLRT